MAQNVIKNNKNIMLLSVFIVLSFIINIAYNYLEGGLLAPFTAGDTSFYVRNASYFIENGFRGLILNQVPFYYWLYPIYLSAFIRIFGVSFSNAIVVSQYLITAFATIIVYKTILLIFNHRIAIVGSLLYVLTWQIFRWSNFVLTDALYIFLIILCLYYLVCLNEHKNLLYTLPIAILFLLLIMLRPSALIFVCISILFIVILLIQQKKYVITTVFIALLFSSLVIVYISMPDVGRYSPSFYWDIYSRTLREGVVYSSMEGYVQDVGINVKEDTVPGFTHYATVIIRRIMHFWSIYTPTHSLRHKVFNILWLVPLFASSLYGFFLSWRDNKTNRYVSYLFAGILVSYTLFHSLTHIDFDQRYRASILIIVIVYSSFGIVNLYDKYVSKIVHAFCSKIKLPTSH